VRRYHDSVQIRGALPAVLWQNRRG
jgi:hypothetical protein